MFEIVFMLAVFALVVLLAFQSEVLRVAPVPTKRAVRRAVLDLLRAETPAHIVELGIGWGGMAADFANTFKAACITGYERALIPRLFSKLRFASNPRVRILGSDIFTANLEDADIVFCYLSPWHMERLSPAFDSKLKKGAVVVSGSFPIHGKAAEATQTVKGIMDIPVHLYRW